MAGLFAVAPAQSGTSARECERCAAAGALRHMFANNQYYLFPLSIAFFDSSSVFYFNGILVVCRCSFDGVERPGGAACLTGQLPAATATVTRLAPRASLVGSHRGASASNLDPRRLIIALSSSGSQRSSAADDRRLAARVCHSPVRHNKHLQI